MTSVPAATRSLIWLVLASTTALEAAESPLAVPATVCDRYQLCDPTALTVPRQPVTRRDYVDLVRPLAAGFEAGPDRGTYGPRHALPALAVFALDGDRKLGAGIKKTLRHYADWVRRTIEQDRGVFSMEGFPLCAFHFRELRRQNLMTPEDERWARELLLSLRQYQCAWRPGDGLWRGSHHRSQCQGLNHALAAAFYPDEPDVAKWRAYAAETWSDWWDFRDVGINDTGYFYSSLGNILRASELLGRSEVFTDPGARQLFDRIMAEVTPDGAAVQYGAHGGYNSHAGARIFALELAAKHTRDGRYRWVAQRLMNFGQARGFSSTHHHIQALSLEDIALASLICDDTLTPVEPDGSSQLLQRKEIVRLTNAQAAEMFPAAGGVDCNMFMTQQVMPHKLVFRSGWNPGDMYMLVECYPRHDPLNPTAILSFERYSAAFAEMSSEKFVSRENAVRIEDLSGEATYLGQKSPRGEKKLPLGWAGMQSTIPAFADHGLATHAQVRVTGYMGYEADQDREFLFVKNRFVLVRDETVFRDRFRTRVGPVWNIQHVGDVRGANWLNGWFSEYYFQQARLYDAPPYDLLIYHAPQPGRSLVLTPEEPDPASPRRLISTRYAWEGDVQPGTRLQFVQILLPHAPARDATAAASRIRILADEPGLAVAEIAELERCEVAILNSTRKPIRLQPNSVGEIVTDARAAYLHFEGGNAVGVLAIDAATLSVGGIAMLRGSTRQTFEKADGN